MNPYRKLLVLAINELLSRQLIDMNGSGEFQSGNESGEIKAVIANQITYINWTHISCDEIAVKVYWKPYLKHAKPVSLTEHRLTASIIVTGWLERRDSKHLQGKGARGICKDYTKRCALDELKAFPDPAPNGYAAEGSFYL